MPPEFTSISSPVAGSPPTGQAPAPAFRTGDAYADYGTRCDPKDPVHADIWQHNVDDYCFLAPSQRNRIVATYQERVDAALSAYRMALGELRVDELLKKDPARSSFFADLLLDVIGLVATSSLTSAFRLLRSAGEAGLQDLGEDAQQAAIEIRKASDRQLETVVRQAVATGKRAIPTKVEQAGEQKKESLIFIDHLTSQSSVVYQRLRENALTGVTDAQLLVMREAFDTIHGHDPVSYRGKLEEQLKRYVASEIGKTGVARNDNYDVVPHGTVDDYFQLETKAFWVELPSGRRLALYRRGHRELAKAGDWFAGEKLDRKGEEVITQWDLDDRPFELLKYVPSEFADIAEKLHVERWHESPTTHPVGPRELMLAEWVSP
jgi:hypothetical protein